MAGKVSSDLQAIILRRPKQFAELIRAQGRSEPCDREGSEGGARRQMVSARNDQR